MYRKRLFRRRMMRVGLVVATAVLFAPKVDLAAAPQLVAFFSVVGLGQSEHV